MRATALLVRPYPANNLTKLVVYGYPLRCARGWWPGLGPGAGATTGLETGNHFMHRCALLAGFAERGIAAKRCQSIAATADSALDLTYLAALVDVVVNLLLKLPANFRFSGGLFHGFGCRPEGQVAGFGRAASITPGAYRLTVSR